MVAHLLREHARSDAAIARQFFADGELERSPRISPQLIEALVEHRYTTHVRELDAFLLRAVLESKGKYVDLPRSLKTALDSRPPPARDDFGGLEALTSEERLRLGLLRKHGFRPTACGQDPAYPGNRQTADLHFRHLLCRVLHIADWSPERAAALLAGGDDASKRTLYDKSLARIGTFLDNVRARLDGHAEQQLRRTLTEEWKGNAPAVLLLLDALAAGKIPPQRASAAPSPRSE
jgi:DNA-binding NtrC family response regulator